MIEWFDQYAMLIAAITGSIAAFSALAGWTCTMVMDHRNEKRLKDVHDRIEEKARETQRLLEQKN